jgi:ribose transport system substrate-binding protein
MRRAFFIAFRVRAIYDGRRKRSGASFGAPERGDLCDSASAEERKESEMLKKRIFSIVSVVVLALSMVACGGGGGGAAETGGNDESQVSADGGGDFHIAYAAVTTSLAPWVVALANEFETMCKDKGWEYDVYDGEGNPAVQTEQINSIIADGNVDLVVLFPVDSEVGVQYVKDLSAAGIDVITMGSDVSEAGQEYVKCHVGPDQPSMIGYTTDYIKDTFGADAALNYVILSGWDMQYDYIVREQAVNDDFADTAYNQLDVSYCGASRDTAMENMANYLVAYDDIDFVVCLSDEFALGAIQAIEAAGKIDDIDVVSVECFRASIPLIKEGKLDLTVTMTGKDVIAKLTEVLDTYLAGDTLDYYQYSKIEPVTKDNADAVSPEY